MPRNFELTSPAAKRDAKAEREVSAATRKQRMLRTLVCGNKYEKAAREQGAVHIAGVDEVGRGCLFGPVVAAAVILPPDTRIQGLRDSKQLTQEDRERLANIVRRKALAVSIIEIDSVTIDRVNIYQATRIAMTQAVLALSPEPDHLLIDAMRLELGPGRSCTQTSIIYGDSLSISIAAASVVAKVYRDQLMCELDAQYPEYGLASHKGYGSPVHLRALEKHGPTPLHRRSFRPVAMAALPWDSIHQDTRQDTQLSLLEEAELQDAVTEAAESTLMAQAALADAVVDEALAGEPLPDLLEDLLEETLAEECGGA